MQASPSHAPTLDNGLVGVWSKTHPAFETKPCHSQNCATRRMTWFYAKQPDLRLRMTWQVMVELSKCCGFNHRVATRFIAAIHPIINAG